MGLNLRRHDFDARRKTELVEKCFAILPRQAKCAHVGHAQTGDDRRNSRGIAVGEFTT
jgi:hypothetical protein